MLIYVGVKDGQPLEMRAELQHERLSGGKLPRVRILVVDDDIGVNRLIRAILQNEGWEVSSAQDGEEAIRMVHEALPDLIILDITMPKISGLEVCRHVTGLFRIPIIMVSAQFDLDTKAQCLSAGAQEFLNKPFRAEELVSRVKAALHLVLPDRGQAGA